MLYFQNKMFNLSLFEHQKMYVKILHQLLHTQTLSKSKDRFVRSNFYILDSKVGSGKTLTVLAYLCELHDLSVAIEHNLVFNCNYGYTQLLQHVAYSSSTDLVIAPHTVFLQWKEEISRIPDLSRRAVFIETKKQALLFRRVATRTLYVLKDTMSVYVNFSEDVHVRNFIVDEPQIVKTKFFRRLRFKLMLWLCATPRSLLRKRNAFISAYFSHAYFATTYERIFCNAFGLPDKYVDECMKLEPYSRHTIQCKESDVLNSIHTYLPPEIAFAFFCNDDSRLKFDQEESVVQAVLKKYRVEINEARAKRVYYESNLNLEEEERQTKINELGKNITCLQSKITNINRIITDMSNSDCTVCMEPLTVSKTILPCGHVFCTMCVVQLSRAVCPYCRATYEPQELKHVKLQACRRTVVPTGPSHKLLELLRLCQTLQNRILLAVRCNKFASKVMDFLTTEGFRVLQLQGQASTIEQKKKKILNNEYQVLVLSDTKVCAGMNLQFINHVVLYSKTKEHVKEQIIGRAWRPGRKTHLQVFELVYPYESSLVSSADYV